MGIDTAEFRDRVLAREQIEHKDIDELIQTRTGEDQFLDYKSGALVQDKDGAFKVRRWTAGFANADGGTLILGVKEPPDDKSPREVDGCQRVRGQALEEWVSNALGPASTRLIPAPVIREIPYPNKGSVVLIATQR